MYLMEKCQDKCSASFVLLIFFFSFFIVNNYHLEVLRASLVAQMAMQETWFQSLGWEDPLEKEMATHSSILVWKTPWTEEPGRSMGLQKSRTRLSDFHSLHPQE